MSDFKKTMFLRPFLLQESIVYAVLVPSVIFFFFKIAPQIQGVILLIIGYVTAQAVLSMVLGIWVKYHFAGPAIRLMESGREDPSEIRRAVGAASILPLAEALTIFFRWAGLAWCSVVLVIYAKGVIGFELLIFGGNILGMTGMSCMAFYYLISEYNMAPFYKWCSARGGDWREGRLVRISLNQKLLLMILLIAIPPIGDLLGLIYLSIFSGMDLSKIQFGFFIIIAQTVVMTFINGMLLMRGLTNSVGRMSLMLKDVAKGEGDLTKRLYVLNADEVGELASWFNHFMDDIESIIGHVKETSLEVHQAVENVSAGSHGLSQSTQEQAASIEEISASIEEMNGTILQNADLIRESNDTASAVTRLIDRSRDAFSGLMGSISEISQDSRKIGDIVLTVNEVAFHTNLLALNASVEAARAGEHGKGFAVVAGEVRSLAQRSAQAAGEIRSLIEGTVTRIKNSDGMVKKTSESFDALMTHLEMFFRMMESISNSSMEQAQNISELNRAISQIDSSTQQNAATVEELASTLENLRSVATILAQDVLKFKISTQ